MRNPLLKSLNQPKTLELCTTLWYIQRVRYEWDPKKEAKNVRKHKVSFADAVQALECGQVLVLKEDSDSGEERYVYLGMCKKLRILVVVVAYPQETTTRIISARKADRSERLFYETQI